MRKLFLFFVLIPFLGFSQFVIQNSTSTIDVYEYTILKSTMSKTGLGITYSGAWIRFVQDGKVINQYKFDNITTPSFSTIDSLVDELRSWLSSSSDTSLWAISNGHIYPKLDTVVVGNISSPTSIFEVESLIRFDTSLNNTILGKDAGNNSITGNYNTLLGSVSGTAITTGYGNIAIGYLTLNKTTTGHDDIGIGREALYKNETGYGNIAIGFQSLYLNVYANNNIAIGYSALRYNSNGARNIATGYQSLYWNTTGADNISIGYSALWDNRTGGKNIGLGVSAGKQNRSGDGNINIGYQSGYSNVSGDYNIFIGCQSGYNETGSNKLYIANSNTTTPLIYGEFDNDFIKINGGFAKNYDTTTVDKTVTLGNHTIECQSSGKTITLPSGTIAGQEYVIVNTSSGTITVSTDGSDYIDNTGTNTSYTLPSGSAIVVAFNGVDRWTIH